MLNLDLRASEAQAELRDSMRELSLVTTKTFVYVFGAGYLAWHLVATGLWPTTLGFQIWPISLTILGASVLTLRLLSRGYLRAAQSVWLLGLALAVLVAVICLNSPPLLLASIVIPFLAMIMSGLLYAVVAEIGIVVFGVLALSVLSALSSSTGYMYATAIGGVCTLLIGWSSSQALLTVTQWSLDAMDKARRAAREAQERRAEWASLAKDLDHAYLRLQRNHAALISAWRTAHEAEKAKSSFISTISHEIRTPLNLIVGFSELMLTAPENYCSEPIPGPYRGDLNSICVNARYLLRLSDDVLDLARSEAGQLSIVWQPTDLKPLIQDVVDMVSEYISAKGLKLDVEAEGELPILAVDPLRIRQVMLNLLVNAARFTDKGGIKVRVTLRDTEVYVEVTDTGQGIRAEDIPKVFEEYQSNIGRSPLAAWQGGTGLGLPISKKLIERHGGQMGVSSTPMKGTTVWFTLPVQREGEGQPSAQDYTLVRTRLPQASLGHKEMVVAVSDDPRVAQLLQRRLGEFRVVHEKTVEDGQRIATETGALALLIAHELPIHHLSADLPVIVLPLVSPREAARAVGANDLVAKPILKEELLEALDGLEQPARRALIVDDDPDSVRLLRGMLLDRMQRQDVLEASTGEEALDLIRKEEPDVVLLDLVLPGMDGYQTLRRLRADPGASDVAVVIVSSSADRLIDTRGGACFYLRTEGSDMRETITLLRSVLDALKSTKPGLLEPL